MPKYSSILIFILAVFLCGIGTYPVHAQNQAAKSNAKVTKVPTRIPKVSGKIQLNGVLDEPFWKDAMVMELNYEVRPGENIKPPVKTEVLLAYTQTHLYVGFRAYDPEPSAIRTRITDRDNIWGNDYVAIILDTFNDERRTYDFFCNPNGVQMDFIESPEGGGDEWDGIWDSCGKITSEGYTVEMSIPFTTIRFKHTLEDQVWGFDAVRSYPRSVIHHIGVFPRNRNNNCLMCQAEKMIGFAGAKPGKNLEFDPTLSAVLTKEKEDFPDGKMVRVKDGHTLQPGLTVKWGITSSLIFNGAINPDFSNVEADVAQLDINTQFTLSYLEKRPFFLEGANLFKTLYRVIYTRALSDPDWGVKLTGKEGKHSIGFFSVRDHITNILFPGVYASRRISIADEKNMGTVLRYRMDVGKTSTIGAVVTDREGDNYYNRMIGIDGDYKFTRRDRFRFQALGSLTKYPEAIARKYSQPLDTLKGTALYAYYIHDTRELDYYIDLQQITSDFRADLGFITQTGYRKGTLGSVYTWWGKRGHWFSVITAGASLSYQDDKHGNLVAKNANLALNYSGPLQSYFNASASLGKRSYYGRIFDYNQYVIDTGFFPSKSFQLELIGIFGDQIDYTNVRQASRVNINPIMQFNLGRGLSIDIDHVFERLTSAVGRLYTANVSNLKMIYHFNRKTFLRTIFQYTNYDYNAANYIRPIEPIQKHFFSQILFSYQLNPRTVLFLGYSDDAYGFQYIPMTQNNWTLFAKVGYALEL